MGKFSNTWRIMKASWWILKQDKELLVFPVFSGVAAALILVSFALPIIGAGVLDTIGQREGVSSFVYLVAFLFYFANYFVLIFFNSAIVACAVMRMEGGDPTVAYGLRAAWQRLPQILGWALVTSTVGFILRMIEERVAIAGQIVVALLGMAWTVTSYLVVPIVVVEGKGPIDAYQHSVKLLKRSWGEQIIGNVGFGLIFLLLGIVPVGLFVLVAWTGSGATIATVIVVGAIYLIGLALVQSTLQAIFQAAVYHYAVEGTAPSGFDTELLEGSFRKR